MDTLFVRIKHMTHSKHTPGPYTQGPDSKSIYIEAIDGYTSDKDLEANACLIAAAPDMLEALKLLLVKKNCDPLALKRIGSAMPQIRAAIAKAEGAV